jgi:hypothetical protein
MLNLNVIRSRLHEGFRPFALVTTDGRTFRVPHPDFVAVGKGVVVVLHPDDTSTTIDALHIVSIENLPNRRAR